MKRPRKRYASEAQIHSAIDALLIKIGQECKTAEDSDRLADQLYSLTWAVKHPENLKGEELSEYHKRIAMAKAARTVADKLRSVQGRRQKTLLALKETLARFKTAPMPFIEDNEVLAKIS